MANCAPANPPQYQTKRICIDGEWHEQLQQKYVCVSFDQQSTWEEWRDVGPPQGTGQPC